ncbi:MAG: hypothetical protein EPO52_10230 [Herbiconiux sp.]|nr:MAG: hypothetical protein EPO52_10230 [Herbiconiux sp.]
MPIGDGDVSRTTVTVTEFYRRVFDAHDAGAVADLVAEDYVQHAKHVPPGRAGLERFVRELFPDGPIPAPESPDTEPVILMGEGDRVVIAAGIPQPDGSGGTFIRYLFDAYRVTDGRLAEHWSGIDADNRPVH